MIGSKMKVYEYTEAHEQSLNRVFSYHAPKEGQSDKYMKIRSLAKELAVELHKLCPTSEEKNIALERLQETVMWSNAAIARNEIV